MRHLFGCAALAVLLSGLSAGTAGAQERDPVTQERETPPGGEVPPERLEMGNAAERRDAERRIEMELGQLETLLRDLETRALTADRPEREDAERFLRPAREQMDKARGALNGLRSAEDGTWAAQSARAEIALEDLRAAYGRARDAVR